MKTTFIYALCEPGTTTVRYIGKTNDPLRRLKEHLISSSKTKTHLGYWLKSLITEGQAPEMVRLREVPGDGSEAERRYIRLARGCRMDLVNLTEGGDGAGQGEANHFFGKTHSEETLKRMRGPKSELHKQNMRKPKSTVEKMRKPKTESHCAAIRKSALGRVQTPEHKAKNSESHRGIKNSQFGKTGPDSANFGKKRAGSSPSYLGVYWSKARKKWIANHWVDGKTVYLGGFVNEADAAKARDAAVIKIFGVGVALNFPTK